MKQKKRKKFRGSSLIGGGCGQSLWRTRLLKKPRPVWSERNSNWAAI